MHTIHGRRAVPGGPGANHVPRDLVRRPVEFPRKRGLWRPFRGPGDYKYGRYLQICLLKLFPLMHEVPDLPHQRLVLVDNGFCSFVIVVEPGRRHGGFDLLDGLFAIRDARLQVVDSLPPGIERLPGLPRLGLLTLALVVDNLPAWGGILCQG